MNGSIIRRRVMVHGDVQGVFFRDTCRKEASRHGVSGWVRNVPDGTVEAVFEGSPGGVEAMVAWVHDGPPQARVTRVDVADEDAQGIGGFDVR